jgi:hypothetical protein
MDLSRSNPLGIIIRVPEMLLSTHSFKNRDTETERLGENGTARINHVVSRPSGTSNSDESAPRLLTSLY